MNTKSLIGKRIPYLKHGYVELIDVMGDDDRFVESARVSTIKGLKTPKEDKDLIHYLMENGHTSPFEMCEVCLQIKLPIYVQRELIRYRTANVNESSQRYTEAIDEFDYVNYDEWRTQDSQNKQSSSDVLLDGIIGKHLSDKQMELHKLAKEVYKERLELGVAREQARIDLPLSVYTLERWKNDIHNIYKMINQRMRHEAQKEIRELAKIVFYKFIQPLFPVASEAFLDFNYNSIKLSAKDVKIINELSSFKHLTNDTDVSFMVKELLLNHQLLNLQPSPLNEKEYIYKATSKRKLNSLASKAKAILGMDLLNLIKQ